MERQFDAFFVAGLFNSPCAKGMVLSWQIFRGAALRGGGLVHPGRTQIRLCAFWVRTAIFGELALKQQLLSSFLCCSRCNKFNLTF